MAKNNEKMKRGKGDFRQNPRFEANDKFTSQYIGDPKLIPRVQQYLQSQKNRKTVSLELITDDLYSRYSEYKRKKKKVFAKAVEKAYEYICSSVNKTWKPSLEELEQNHLEKRRKLEHDSSVEDSDADTEKSFSSSNPEYVPYEDKNAINNFLTDMYKKTPSRPGSRSNSRPSSQPSSNPNSAPGTPQRVAPSDDIELPFTMDRTGDVKLLPSEGHTSSTCELGEGLKPGQKDLSKRTDSKPVAADNFSCNEVGTALKNVASKIVDSSQVVASPVKVSDEVKRAKSANTVKLREKKTADSSNRSKSTKKSRHKADPEEKKKAIDIQQSTVKFADIGGNEKSLKEVCKLLVHMKHPEVYKQLGVTPPRGFLLHGPPGCGKTLLAHAIAGELELPFIKLAATEIVSGVSGESEEKLRDLFDKAVMSAPCIMFLDEIDAITQKRETASKDMERRIVSQLLTCMDDLNSALTSHVLVIGATNRPDSLDPALRRAGRFDREISLGIPDERARISILQVLCRGLRLPTGFDYLKLARLTPGFVGADLMALAREAAITAVNRIFHELEQQKKTDTQLEGISSAENSQLPITGSESLINHPSNPKITMDQSVLNSMEEVSVAISDPGKSVNIATDSSGISDPGLSMEREVQESPVKSAVTSVDEELASVLCWLKDTPPLSEEQLQSLWIDMNDFEAALKVVQPSAKREGFATIPDVTWEDVGALQDVREELQMAILAPVRHPEQYKALGVTSPPGVLLAGPPGCGKTLLAKAIASESGVNFISVKGPELLNMYVGESERAVRQVFQRARNSSPCVIFFDELDALCPRRSDHGEGGASVRVVNQLLTEMDGLEERKQVFVMGATNRPDIIDPAVLRPGRLDKILYVGLPAVNDRLDILKTLTKNGTKPCLAEDVDLNLVASDVKCQGFTGADLAALVREAAVAALREFMKSPEPAQQPTQVKMAHFEAAFRKVRPSVSAKEQSKYDSIRNSLQSL